MRPKRKHTRVTHEDAVAMVRAYHLDGKTQAEIAKQAGIGSGYACRIVHGDARPEAFDEVFPGAR